MEEKEYTIESFIIKVRTTVLTLKKKWLFIGISMAIFVFLFVFFRSQSYVAESSIFLKNSKQSKLFSIASTLGLGGETEVSFDKIKSVVESDYILNQLLFTKIKLKKKEDYLYNHLVDFRKFDKSYKITDPQSKHKVSDESQFIQDSISLLFAKALKTSISVMENKEQLIVIGVKNKSEEMAVETNRALIKLILQFFKDVEIKDDLHSQKVLQNRLDSVKDRLLYVESANASIVDHSVNMVRTAGLLEKRRSERDLRILNEMYIEIMKQLEIMNFKLLDKKSPIYVLSSPRYPLVPKKRSLLVSIIIGSLLGFVVSSSFVLMKQRYKSAIAQIKGARHPAEITT